MKIGEGIFLFGMINLFWIFAGMYAIIRALGAIKIATYESPVLMGLIAIGTIAVYIIIKLLKSKFN